jgi:hypothetical protein
LCRHGTARYLGRNLSDARVLILGTYREGEIGREHPLEETLHELIRERLVEEVNVRRLSVDGTAALIRRRLPRDYVSNDLVAVVGSATPSPTRCFNRHCKRSCPLIAAAGCT